MIDPCRLVRVGTSTKVVWIVSIKFQIKYTASSQIVESEGQIRPPLEVVGNNNHLSMILDQIPLRLILRQPTHVMDLPSLLILENVVVGPGSLLILVLGMYIEN